MAIGIMLFMPLAGILAITAKDGNVSGLLPLSDAGGSADKLAHWWAMRGAG